MGGWVDGWMDGWMDGWVGVKAVLRIAYSNQKNIKILLDGCLTNNYKRRLPTNLVTHSELYAYLVGKNTLPQLT
jgi:hypothetical protein